MTRMKWVVLALAVTIPLACESPPEPNGQPGEGDAVTLLDDDSFGDFTARVNTTKGIYPIYVDKLVDFHGEPDAKLRIREYIDFCAQDPNAVGHHGGSPITEAYFKFKCSSSIPVEESLAADETRWRDHEGFNRCRIWLYRWNEPATSELYQDTRPARGWRMGLSYFFLIRDRRVIATGRLVREWEAIR